MQESLVYIDFNNDGYYTLVGGVKVWDLSIEKESVETFDCTDDNQLLIPGSGVKKASFSVDGVLDPALPEELHEKFIESLVNGTEITARFQPITSGTKRLQGKFICQKYDRRGENQQEETFRADYKSSGKLSVS